MSQKKSIDEQIKDACSSKRFEEAFEALKAGEQKKPQAGEWWINDDSGLKVYFIGKCPEGILVWKIKHGDVAYADLDWSGWHHEPRCTGWEWQPEPEPKWFDLTAMDGHVLRDEIDWYEKDNDNVWLPIRVYSGATIGSMKEIWGHFQQFRCLLKDAPKDRPEPKVFDEYETSDGKTFWVRRTGKTLTREVGHG